MFYDNYIRLCEKIGKSPSAVAIENGITKSNVTYWKKGRNMPSDVTLAKLAAYFGCTVSDLKDDIEQKEKPTIHGEPLPKITQDLLADIQKLNLDEQQAMWAVVQAIISKRGEDK